MNSLVGHDLLQPLHAAHLFTDALWQQLRDPVQRLSVQQIRGALDSTTDLLTGLLDMSRLEAGGLVPEPRDLPLAEVLEPLVSEFRAMAAERGLGFHFLPTRAWTHSDPQLLRRILQNFLANAVRYTDSGGILLGVRRVQGGLRIEVHDTGPGIGAGDRQSIFEEFRRGEDARGQGLGLGLSIADRISRLLGAALTLRSRPGAGSVFAVQVPRVQANEPQAMSGGNRGGWHGRKVLAVDNDPEALAALRAVLEGWGCKVASAGDGEEAAGALERDTAELWVFDYHLEHGDTGVALAQRLRERIGPRPCLLLSADQSDVVRRAVHEAGFVFLAKPVRPLALKSVLDRLMAARAAGQVDETAAAS